MLRRNTRNALHATKAETPRFLSGLASFVDGAIDVMQSPLPVVRTAAYVATTRAGLCWASHGDSPPARPSTTRGEQEGRVSNRNSLPKSRGYTAMVHCRTTDAEPSSVEGHDGQPEPCRYLTARWRDDPAVAG